MRGCWKEVEALIVVGLLSGAIRFMVDLFSHLTALTILNHIHGCALALRIIDTTHTANFRDATHAGASEGQAGAGARRHL